MHPQLVALAALPVPNRLAPGQVKQGFPEIVSCFVVHVEAHEPPVEEGVHLKGVLHKQFFCLESVDPVAWLT
jgi:hypothetical protein